MFKVRASKRQSWDSDPRCTQALSYGEGESQELGGKTHVSPGHTGHPRVFRMPGEEKNEEKKNRKSSHSTHDCHLILKSLHGADSINSTSHSYFIERKNALQRC